MHRDLTMTSPRGRSAPHRRRQRLLFGAILSLLFLTAPLAAAEVPATAPSVAELLATCGRGYAHGDQGVDAAACEWFANPCGCKLGAGRHDGPGWCVPAAEPPDATVLEVVAALRHFPDHAAPVDQVVPEILARIYPCAPGTGGLDGWDEQSESDAHPQGYAVWGRIGTRCPSALR